MIRHGVAQGALTIDLDQPGPVGHRRHPLAAKRVQVTTEQTFGIATGRRTHVQACELRQHQIEDLPGPDFQHPLGEEAVERVGQAITGDLENALIDREQHQPGRALGLHRDRQRFARTNPIGRIDPQRRPTRTAIDRERDDAVTQRTHEDFVRSGIAQELDVHIAIAFEVAGHPYALHRGGGLGLEPGMGVDPLPFDRDQTGAGIGRPDGDLDLLTGSIVGLGQAQLQLGIAFQRATQVGIAGHIVFDPVQLAATGITHQQGEAARPSGSQRPVQTLARQAERCLVEHRLPQSGLVLERPGILPGQHRDIAPLDPYRT